MRRMRVKPRRWTKDKSAPAAPQQPVTPHDDAAPLVDTSKMNDGQRAAMEVAEAARGTADVSGFARDLLMGRADLAQLQPFPAQEPDDSAIGDDLVVAVSSFLLRNLDADLVDETRTIPEEVIEGLRQLGVFRMKVPREYGGLGLSQVNYNRVVAAIASHCGSTAVLVSAHQSIGVPQPLKMFGTPEQKKRFLPRLAQDALSAFALTEPDVGSDPAKMTTTATLSADGTHYVLNGDKLWTTNGPIADLLVVMAQTAPKVVRGRTKRRITAFIVDTKTEGIEVVHRCDFMGLRGIQNGVMRFTDVKVPAENVLLGEGAGLRLALETLNTGRLTLPAACAAMSKRGLAIARAWCAERVQWGHAIGEHEAGAVKLTQIASTTFAMEAVTNLTSHWADAGRDVRIEAAMAKLFASEAAWDVVDTTLQLRGGRGYERATSLRERGETPHPVERLMRDCRINRIIEGTTDIMHLVLAREAVDPHLKLAADLLRPGTTVRAKARAALGAGLFYARWYPARRAAAIFAGRRPTRDRLTRHEGWIRRASHALAAQLFHAMLRHGPKLEKRQALLAPLMETATELFVMAATCSMARHRDDAESAALADVFCRDAKRRIASHRRAARMSRKADRAIARGILGGEYRWLEDGIVEG